MWNAVLVFPQIRSDVRALKIRALHGEVDGMRDIQSVSDNYSCDSRLTNVYAEWM